MIVGCAGCHKPITGRFLVNVLDRSWHSECVMCSECGMRLTDKCFCRDGKLYCNTDFFRRFGTKCAGCLEGISPKDMVRKARSRVFHLKCFTCCYCRKQLDTGEELYVIDDNRFLCTNDYKRGNIPGKDYPVLLADTLYMSDDEEMDCMEPGDTLTSSPSEAPSYLQDNPRTPLAPPTPKSPHSIPPTTDIEKVSALSIKEEDNSDDDFDGDKLEDDKKLNDDDKGNKRRGPRTTIKAKQLEVLKSAFNKTPKPTRHIREQLAKETGLPMRVIQVWFQNKRSKERRMKQLSSMGMRAHIFQNPRKMRDIGFTIDDNGYPCFPPYNAFPGQQFPAYFGPQPMGYPHSEFGLAPNMEQPLPAGGPMGGDFPPMTTMSNLMGETFGQHPTMPTSTEDMAASGGPAGFSDHTNPEVMAW